MIKGVQHCMSSLSLILLLLIECLQCAKQGRHGLLRCTKTVRGSQRLCALLAGLTPFFRIVVLFLQPQYALSLRREVPRSNLFLSACSIINIVVPLTAPVSLYYFAWCYRAELHICRSATKISLGCQTDPFTAIYPPD